MEYGRKIAELRSRDQLTQEELADRLYVSRDLVSKWENDKRRPNHQMLLKLCSMFQVDIRYFESESMVLMDELAGCVPKNDSISPADLPMLLNHFLKTISERDANIFVRRYYFCETPSEISGKYGGSEVYVRVVLSRTRKKLKSFLERGVMN